MVVLAIAAAVLLVGLALTVLRLSAARGQLGSAHAQAAVDALRVASRAAAHLRGGLAGVTAAKAARPVRDLLRVSVVALTDTDRVVAFDGAPSSLQVHALTLAQQVIASAAPTWSKSPEPGLRAVAAPLWVDGQVIGALVAYAPHAGPALVRAADEVAAFVSAQLTLAERDADRARLAEAEVRALRAQISPHFVYNSLAAIAAYVRTDPEHARELLLEFADFTRYSFRRHGQFTTLADELGNTDRYLTLERARFGDRLQVSLLVAPEVLGVVVPFLCLQPVVENAVRHGLEHRPGVGTVRIVAIDEGSDCVLTVEDDGVGAAPEQVRASLLAESGTDSVGIGNVDQRLRSVYGDAYGLVVESAPGEGTKVTMRIPKFHDGVTIGSSDLTVSNRSLT